MSSSLALLFVEISINISVYQIARCYAINLAGECEELARGERMRMYTRGLLTAPR